METEEYKGYEIKVIPDEMPSNPREEWDNLGKMVYKNRNYKLGDEEIAGDPIDWLLTMLDRDGEETEYSQQRLHELGVEFFEKFAGHTVYKYEHGSIGLSTSNSQYPFNCRWDGGQAGYIYCSLENAKKNWMLEGDSVTWETEMEDWYEKGSMITLRTATERVLDGEVEVFGQYLNGEVYGYTVVDSDGEELDSCWGYYGDVETSGLMDEAKSIIDHRIDERKKEYEKKNAYKLNPALPIGLNWTV